MKSQVGRIVMSLLLGAGAGYFFGLKSQAGPVLFRRVPATITVGADTSSDAKVYRAGDGAWLVVMDDGQYLIFPYVTDFVLLSDYAYRAEEDVAMLIRTPPHFCLSAGVVPYEATPGLTVHNHSLEFYDVSDRKVVVKTSANILVKGDEKGDATPSGADR